MRLGRTSKYTKYKLLSVDDLLLSSMPETKKFTKENFFEFIENHTTFIVKPSNGYQGFSVKKITSIDGHYILHTSNKKEIFHDVTMLYTRLKKGTRSRRYRFILQEYIPLATIDDRPFDVQVIVQRKVNSDWIVTGMYSKIAKEGFFITNLRTKSSVKKGNESINLSNIDTGKCRVDNILLQINKIAITVAAVLSNTFPKHNIGGIDIGIDQEGKVWIIEANAGPGIEGFRKLKDRTVYKTIKKIRGITLSNVRIPLLFLLYFLKDNH